MKLCYGRVLLGSVTEKRGSKVWDEVCIYGGSQEKQCYIYLILPYYRSNILSIFEKILFYFFFSYYFFSLQKDLKREGVRYEEQNVGTVSVSPIKKKREKKITTLARVLSLILSHQLPLILEEAANPDYIYFLHFIFP